MLDLGLNAPYICTVPKQMSTIPPVTPITSLTADSAIHASSPTAKSITSVNSTSACAVENRRPLLVPHLAPWERLAKNRGPGAKAPEAVTSTMVTTKLRISTKHNDASIVIRVFWLPTTDQKLFL